MSTLLTVKGLAERIEAERSGAIFSEDRLHRYVLWRRLDPLQADLLAAPAEGIGAFCMLNPSKADEMIPDPTITKVMGYCTRWGLRAAVVVNLYAFRSTDPKGLLGDHDIIGPDNDDWIEIVGRLADRKFVAWGAGVRGVDVAARARDVLHRFGVDDVMCLGVTKTGGFPLHPGRLSYSLPPVPYRAP
jgi:hypothetical protein